ncbi:MAG: serine--tRNA ligase [Candidatus Ryanbacteria bacterium RIFCSPHIGHO2_02_FULL_45_43]|uniref:Serine--tRNA ligase n=1 Tax=Candidatus Ryanbacteria bacterium RIFCSPHIGHO2_01_45_13 TaxID=1802112 RepID=A0A1G2FZM9_9BACT|nr:MAG: serine--tRNA ligase [Candidatus Ryanbacteria bacterium RIFCSPHIGHO2_01_FULL_44_130]OGZ43544.1 MAG: serine--tRNA ligase [Candidatus Ryanbacteria bacterium RIFCSPHIGHO2_01_45_13]OGZ47920.1 MAG: serine--tRNA ligase [Candidatus Ryanbacteria bacterium RIFCSPHIGHO2_02_FULL_45_43]OGZ49934.1 MAG: serine--tRNA ligase [Candidatus Ryanbacteria bacterium RIFCSPHIGHO2_12_FULL_44_20]OGZ51043.1 MAG: serine--tRNA ligase [Candidatus Ryanbacteria bacterium RIFCSPLOWO2_01_FULL_44_230]OGZ54252.1 MAG: seri
MLDIRFIRENPDLIREAARKKGVQFDISKLLKTDESRKRLLGEVEALRSRINKTSDEIALMSNENERSASIEKMREVKTLLAKMEEELKTVDYDFKSLMLDVPNIPDPSVPEGKSDADNVEVRRWGNARVFDLKAKDHLTIMKELDLVDIERGAKVSGMRGYFLKGDVVVLSFALWKFAVDHLVKKGFELFGAPAIVKGEHLIGTGHFPQTKDDVYSLGDNHYLSATAEISMMGYHTGEIFDEVELPKKYVAFSPCYRREAGSYGKDTKGIYRVHEFYKVEQLMLVKNDHQESVRWHEELTKNAEELMQMLNIPYRVVVNCGGDIGRAHVKTYDIESWIPSENRYRETHSSSYYHDFQTRRFNIRYRGEDGKIQFTHSLNNTVIATPRILIAILENNQQPDGSVVVPEALRSFVGKDVFRKPSS